MIAAVTTDVLELGAGFLRANKAVLFADVVDFVRLSETDEEGTVFRWVAFADQFQARLEASGKGRLVKRMGDGLLAVFDDTYDAVQAAKDLRTALLKLNEPLDANLHFQVRIGVDTGEILHSADNDLYGQ